MQHIRDREADVDATGTATVAVVDRHLLEMWGVKRHIGSHHSYTTTRH